MQYLVAINQTKALAWGLNAQQAMLFAFLHQVPTWAATRQIDGHTFFNISKTKIVEELPLLTDKPDTAYRLMKQLAGAGLIVMTSCDNRTYMRLTPKARTWNRSQGSEKSPTPSEESPGSEKNPTPEKSPRGVGKISEPGSEKSPTNQDTNDQVTKDQTPSLSDAGENASPNVFERAAQQTDDGTPPPTRPRRFAMTLDWQPDEGELAVACLRAGLAQNIKPEPHQLAKFTAHHADHPERQHGAMAWTAKLVDWLRNDLRAAQPTGGTAHDRSTADRQRNDRADREAVRQQLADPHDTSWADGWWPGEPGDPAPGAGAGAGGPGVHPAGGDLPEDVLERVPECGSAQAEQARTGDGTGEVAGAADPAGDRASDQRPETAGEYLAADDPGADRAAGADTGGLRHARSR